MTRANEDIRQAVKASGVRWWQIADHMGQTEAVMSRRLRYELTDQEKDQIRAAVAAIKGV